MTTSDSWEKADEGLGQRTRGPAAVPRPAADWGTVIRLRGLLTSGGFDVLHAHGLRAGALSVLALDRAIATRRWKP